MSLILFISIFYFSKLQYDIENNPFIYSTIDDEGALTFALNETYLLLFHHDKQILFNTETYDLTEKDIPEVFDKLISGRNSMHYSPDLKSVVYVCNRSVLIVKNIREESRQFIYFKFVTEFNLRPYLQPRKFYGWEDYDILNSIYSPESNELIYFFLYSPNEHKFLTFFYNVTTQTHEKIEKETKPFSGWRDYLRCTNKWKQYDNNHKYILCITGEEAEGDNHINSAMVGIVLLSGLKNIDFIDFVPLYSFPDTEYILLNFYIFDNLERYDSILYIHKKSRINYETTLEILFYKNSILQNKSINKDALYKKIVISEPTFDYIAGAIDFNNELFLCYGQTFHHEPYVFGKCLRMDNSENVIDSFIIHDQGGQIFFFKLLKFSEQKLVVVVAGSESLEFSTMTLPVKLSAKAQVYSVEINKNLTLKLESNILSKSFMFSVYFTSLPTSDLGKIYVNDELAEINKIYVFGDRFHGLENKFTFNAASKPGTYNFKYKIYNNEGYYSSEADGEIIVKCSGGLYLYNGECISVCSDNVYIDDINKRCMDDCSSATYKDEINRKCLTECPEYTDIKNKKCVDKCPEGTIEDENKMCLEEEEEEEVNGDIDYYIDKIDDNLLRYTSSDSFIKYDHYYLQVYKYNDNKNINIVAKDKKLSIVNLDQCIKDLKSHYSISDNEDLIIIKIDEIIENSSVNKVTFLSYDLKGNKLDNSICKNVEIKKPIVNENLIDFSLTSKYDQLGINIFNPKDKFFNDICYAYTSENGTDLTLKDRRKLIYQNASCEYNCEYSSTNYEEKFISCICSPVTEKLIAKLEPFPKNPFGTKLTNFNGNVLKCTKLIFDGKVIKKNYGFFYSLILIISTLVTLFFFYKIGYAPLSKMLNHFINLKTSNSIKTYYVRTTVTQDNMKPNPTKKKVQFKNQNQNQNKNQNKNKNKNQNKNQKEKEKEKEKLTIIDDNQTHINSDYDTLDLHNKVLASNTNLNTHNDLNITEKNNIEINQIEDNNNVEMSDNGENIIKLYKKDPFELNKLEFEEAIVNDNRTLFQMYINYLQKGHIIINTFITECYFELRTIKIMFFIFYLFLLFFLNAFLYTNNNVNKANSKKGKVDFIGYLPRSIYSCLICYVICIFLNLLTNNQRKYDEAIKKGNDSEKITEECKKILSNLKIKLLIFIIIVIVFEIFFFYYLTAFCAVYQNNNKLWIYSGFISLIIMCIVPFIFCLILAALRYMSIKYKYQYLYKALYYIDYVV